MENWRHNSMSKLWFNSQLFTLEGAPVKFDLVGYSPTEYRDLVKILEAYGGQLANREDPDTLIFCEANRHVGVEEYERYDIKFFHDSITALRLQQLAKYRLTTEPIANLRAVDWPSPTEENSGSDLSMDFPFDSGLKTQSKAASASTHFSGVDRLRNGGTDSSSKLHSHDKIFYHDDGGSDLSDVRSVSERGVQNRSFFEEKDDEAILNWVIKKHVMPTKFGECIWKDFIQEKVLPHLDVTPRTFALHFATQLRTHPKFVKHVEVAKASGCPVKAPVTVNAYTKQENRLIVQYFVENGSSSNLRNKTIWLNLLKEFKSVMKPGRTASGISLHYRKNLHKHYARFIDDPRTLKQFKERKA